MINHLYILEEQELHIPYDAIKDKTEYIPN